MALWATLTAHHGAIEPGRTLTVPLTIRNEGGVEQVAQVWAEGHGAEWVAPMPLTLPLSAGAAGQVMLYITPPRHPSSHAGSHRLTLVVAPLDQPTAAQRLPLTLQVAPTYDFAFGPLLPPKLTLRGFHAHAPLALPRENRSNVPAAFRLEATGRGLPCRFEFQQLGEGPSLVGQVELSLAAGERVEVPLHLVPPTRPLLGGGGEACHYSVQATMLAGERPRRALSGVLVNGPRIGGTAVALMILLIAALLGAGAMRLLAPAPPIHLSALPQEDPREARVRAFMLTPLAVPLPATLTPTNTPAAGQPAPTPGPALAMTYEAMFREIAAQYGLDWTVLAGVAFQESGINPLALGRDHDMGLMQIIPMTWDQIAPRVGVSNPYDPYSNAQVSAAFLAYLRTYLASLGVHDERLMLVAYNWGPNNVRLVVEAGGGWNEIPRARQAYALNVLRYARSSRPPAMQRRLQEPIESAQ